jgi:hypothetical protein
MGLRKAMDGQKQIIDEIEAYISQGGGEYQDWYVGMTNNPIDPLTEASLLHKVENHRFMYIETISQQVAKAVADYFVNVLGTDGNLNDEEKDGACQALYVYKKAVHLVGYKTSDSIQSVC